MGDRLETLTVTLHWVSDGREQANTVVCEDSAPAHILPLLAAGCGLSTPAAAGRGRLYTLRLGAADGLPLRDDQPLSAHGVRSGSHLWLSTYDGGGPHRCLLGLPDGSTAALPQHGVKLTRAWLLELMALLNPAAHLRELELLERRESPYGYVSRQTHCTLGPGPDASWAITTARADVATLLNGERLFPEAAAPLGDGDRLTIGAYGPTLTISLVER